MTLTFCMRFGIRDKRTHTLEETGKGFGITGERIRQIGALAFGNCGAIRASIS